MIKFYFKKRKPRSRIKAKSFYFKKDKETFLFRICVAFLIICILFVIGEIVIYPIIKDAGETVLKNQLSQNLNEAVNTLVKDENYVYDDFVTLNVKDNGEVTSITSNTMFINTFKADLTEQIGETLKEKGDFAMYITLGNLLNTKFVSVKGIKLKIDSDTYSYTVTEIHSTFESAGINQTLHKIYAEAEISAIAYVGNIKVYAKIKSKVPVAETVIVGNVPNAYYVHD